MKKKLKIFIYVFSCTLAFSGCSGKLQKISKGTIIKDFINTKPKVEIEVDTTPTEKVKEDIESLQQETIVQEPNTDIDEEITIEEVETSESSENIIVCANTDLNIRTGNNTDSLIIGNLKVNETAYRILSCDNNWDLVKTNDMIGYACRDYLSYTTETYKVEYIHTPHNDIVVTTTDLNFRVSPDTSAERISTFKANTELQVVAKIDNGWLLVKHNGIFGYVHGDYVISLFDKVKEQYPDLQLTELIVDKVVYSNTSLNVRVGNSTDYESLGLLEKYETMRVLYEIDDWYFVLLNDYSFGFVSKEYTTELTDIFVDVDKSEQRLYLYNNNELYYVIPVTTGKDSTPSDTGLFEIYNMTKGTYLTGADYHVWVDYWIAYNGGEGLHDAKWHNRFGTDLYKNYGSHGCVNLPPDMADEIYESVSVGNKVIVHK